MNSFNKRVIGMMGAVCADPQNITSSVMAIREDNKWKNGVDFAVRSARVLDRSILRQSLSSFSRFNTLIVIGDNARKNMGPLLNGFSVLSSVDETNQDFYAKHSKGAAPVHRDANYEGNQLSTTAFNIVSVDNPEVYDNILVLGGLSVYGNFTFDEFHATHLRLSDSSVISNPSNTKKLTKICMKRPESCKVTYMIKNKDLVYAKTVC